MAIKVRVSSFHHHSFPRKTKIILCLGDDISLTDTVSAILLYVILILVNNTLHSLPILIIFYFYNFLSIKLIYDI